MITARRIRPEPRCFEHFPENAICPICGTNDDGKTVLVQIAETENDGIAEAKPIHLSCAAIRLWYDDMRRGVTWPLENE